MEEVNMKKNNLTKDMIDIGVGTAIGGMSIGIVNQSNLSTPIKQGTSGLIGVGILSNVYKKSKKYLE